LEEYQLKLFRIP